MKKTCKRSRTSVKKRVGATACVFPARLSCFAYGIGLPQKNVTLGGGKRKEVRGVTRTRKLMLYDGSGNVYLKELSRALAMVMGVQQHRGSISALVRVKRITCMHPIPK